MATAVIFLLGRGISGLACAALFVASCAAAEILPQQLSIDSNGRAIAVTRYAAEGLAARPAVLLLHGSGGLDVNLQSYAHHARILAENGIDGYLVRYFSPGSNARCYCWDIWAQTVADVTAAIVRRPEASGRLGLLGFSLGGAVAISSARDPRVTALVVFYGFIPNDEQRARIHRVPPLLVLHGAADDNVPLSSGEDLVNLARQRGGSATLVVYPGETHGHATWSKAAATDAVDRTIAFFRAELTGQ
jgi:carboxymethylenebutenolidase